MSELERNKDFSRQSSFEQKSKLEFGFKYSYQEALKYIRHNIPIILFGPPGTGKSYIFNRIYEQLKSRDEIDLYEVIQFHRKFSYEDFIEGFVPGEDGFFTRKDGSFKAFCKKVKSPDKINLFVIDEINRAELSTTLGEALYLLEDRSSRSVRTSHFSDEFSIPESVSLVGTMNTADRSIAHIDFAIRRRFRFIPVFPDFKVLKELLLGRGWNSSLLGIELVDYCKACQTINYRIRSNPVMGRHMELGQMMFTPLANEEEITPDSLLTQFVYIIIPQIEAYAGYGNENLLSEIISPTIAAKYLNSELISLQDIQSLIIDLCNSREND